ncbi:DUF1254 domain-containing protein [Myxococcus sp. MISCRS1]|uniref:DUF1254 domain-containing protein n=1 Tax=Myxococcus sp. MISCRS1 TaxID=2996786 RepID=UPI002272121D|nr:DUF1254 domain-containing protein [Myxococcus sp. MISCRS1]MCY1003589.1 DUF1254 domain-containing protein [Myxococcus sp. MISCRS1]
MLEQSTTGLSPQEARDIAREAYVFGLPLVEHYRLFALNFRPESPQLRPANQFLHFSRLFTSEDREVVSPNNDTLYSVAVLDLRGGPVVVETPELNGRYFCIQLVDITTNNLPYIGTRATGTAPGRFVVSGPDWTGPLPEPLKDASIIRSDSWFVAALLRVGVDGPKDLAAAVPLQREFKATPLHVFSGLPAPKLPEVSWPPYFDDKADASLKAFEYINFMMRWHRFSDAERPLLARLARVGVRPGESFDAKSLPPDLRDAMLAGVREARESIQQRPMLHQGWELPDPKVGDFGDDYALRARVAWNYLYANSAAEAVYPITHLDGAGRPLDGARARYVLRFPKEAIPPVRFFWSLTAYDAKSHMLVENDIHRYSLGDRSRTLRRSEDGSISFFLQSTPPEAARQSNWLPVPTGPFYLLLRLYGPTEAALRGRYVPPAVEALND